MEGRRGVSPEKEVPAESWFSFPMRKRARTPSVPVGPFASIGRFDNGEEEKRDGGSDSGRAAGVDVAMPP